MTYCCGKPETCAAVCRRKADFAERIWEIDGFDLSNTPRGPLLAAPALPPAIPIIFHGSSRIAPAAPGIAALQLSGTFGRRSGDAKLGSPEELRARYWLAPETELILTANSGVMSPTIPGNRRPLFRAEVARHSDLKSPTVPT